MLLSKDLRLELKTVYFECITFEIIILGLLLYNYYLGLYKIK